MFDDMFDDDIEEDDVFAPATAEGLRSPRETSEIFGNDTTEQTLLGLYNAGTLPHALVFAGPMGVGKATMAFRLARFLLKDGAGAADTGMDSLFGDVPVKPTSFHVDENDSVFRKVASGGHPDLRFIERAVDPKTGVKKGVLDVDTVRAIAPFLRKTTAEGGWRVVIVDEADSMNRNAQNAILKILEEPPEKCLIILICNRLGSMLPTIRSRCRVFHFAPLAGDSLLALLRRASPSTPESELKLLAALSDGSMGRAQTMLEEGGINTLRTLISFFEDWPRWSWARIHPMADTLARPESEKAYLGFATVFGWITTSFLKSKAIGGHALPEILASDRLEPLKNHYSLEQWIEICEKLKNHFVAIDQSNLDRRQGVLGAFGILG